MFAQCVEFMEAKFKKYWQRVSPLYCVAAVIDHRVKLQGVKYMINRISSRLRVTSDIITTDTIRSNMSKLYDAYNEKYGGSHSFAPTPSNPVRSYHPAHHRKKMMNLHGFGFDNLSSSYTHSELENYCEINFSACFDVGQDGLLGFSNFDLLSF